ncbi:hypothetical protein Q4Q39_13560 [Flavivirga amylovorans]|uniref:DUF1735 domain-containing protein n=1 Tax=Flavivirga amylovorans TaxID=870486 RepID=A0ABT8X4B7_9FLAO|nr:hypothetical protein [Flavivirga amylovorans]MDO5988434.1 hypothetical protein [Flavivirga amylovorans]
MKNIKFLLLITIITFVSFSCDNDGGDSALVLETGAIPNFVKDAASDQIFDLTKILNGSAVNLAFNASVAQGSPSSADIIATYSTLAGPTYTSVLFTNVTLPGDFSLTTNDVIAAFSELSSTDDFKLGDVLTVSARFTMSDGRVLSLLNDDGTDNTGTTVSNSGLFAAKISYPVSCPTMLEGNYISTVIASSLPIAGNFRSPQPVTITQPAAGTYNLSDGTADIFGPDFPVALEFTDVCGTITVTENSIPFGAQVAWVQGAGTSLDQDTGVITLDLTYTATSCCGLAGIQFTLQLTPN